MRSNCYDKSANIEAKQKGLKKYMKENIHLFK